MPKAAAEKNCKHFLYDNPNLKETKCKKVSDELEDCENESEIWILQCPKNFDPKKMLSIELGKMGKKSSVECSADRFTGKKTLACIAPEKAAEYELVCDNIKLVS